VVTPAVERYDIHLADLDPTRGREIATTRPVVVVSRNEMNRIQVLCAGRNAEIAVDRIRTIDRAQAARLRRLITEMYGE
jgi:mRNA-degrading endonuclease toxin of MazEF toxin-antitoxin module